MQAEKPPDVGIAWRGHDELLVAGDPEQALWVEHPVHGRRVDVVALPLSNLAGAELHPYPLGGADISLGPMSPLCVIGFPFGRTAGGTFGIWTRGFIASEPDVDFDDLPCFLLDARTREGQSGSPVIYYSRDDLLPAPKNPFAPTGSQTSKLIGVYSGRINAESDLGIVWKVQAVEEILRAGVPGTAHL